MALRIPSARPTYRIPTQISSDNFCHQHIALAALCPSSSSAAIRECITICPTAWVPYVLFLLPTLQTPASLDFFDDPQYLEFLP